MSTGEISGTVNETVVMGGPTYSENLTVDPNDPINDTDGVVAPASGDGIDTVPTTDASDIFLNNQGSITGGSGAIGANFAYGISQLDNAGSIAGGASTTGVGGAGVEISYTNAGYGFNAGTMTGGDGSTTGGAGLVLNAGASFDNTFVGVTSGGNGTDGGDGGAGAIVNGGFLVNDGNITGGTGTHGGTGVVMNGGFLEDLDGTISGGNGSTGLGAGVVLNDGASLEVEATIQGGVSGDPTYGDSVDFGTGGGTLYISEGAVLNGSIGGFGAGDTIAMYGASDISVTDATSTSATLSYTYDSVTDTVTLAGDFSGGAPSVNGYVVTAACYVRGTRIRTPLGEQAIESLTVGSTVLTASGENRQVQWLGHRTVNCTTHPNPADVWPVRIAANALADNVPLRDLWVSPGHSILFDGCLIQARNLINGVTVQQIPRDQVEYWHLELENHNVIFAEELPAETYLDTGNRTAFENGGAFIELYPTFEPKHWTATCYPLELDGPRVTQAREHLLKRVEDLGYCVVEEADAHLKVDGRRIDPMKLTNGRLVFTLPEDATSIELFSRTFVPTHVDASSRDSRNLGLCVTRLQIDGSDVALDDDSFFGAQWHQFEVSSNDRPHRWSKGRTTFPSGTRLVVIDLSGRGFYRVAHAVTAEPMWASA